MADRSPSRLLQSLATEATVLSLQCPGLSVEPGQWLQGTRGSPGLSEQAGHRLQGEWHPAQPRRTASAASLGSTACPRLAWGRPASSLA